MAMMVLLITDYTEFSLLDELEEDESLSLPILLLVTSSPLLMMALYGTLLVSLEDTFSSVTVLLLLLWLMRPDSCFYDSYFFLSGRPRESFSGGNN